MATDSVTLPAKQWTLVSEESVLFQIPDRRTVFAAESVLIPIDTSIRKRISPGKIYSFQKLNGDLYIYNPNSEEIVVTVEVVI